MLIFVLIFLAKIMFLFLTGIVMGELGFQLTLECGLALTGVAILISDGLYFEVFGIFSILVLFSS